jgi:hypothetical protein
VKKSARSVAAAAPSAETAELKERVLHTRVPDSLERRIKHKARNLGLSVSTVVRHVLMNTFGLVEDIVTDSTNLALSIAGEDSAAAPNRRRRRTDEGASESPGPILAWHEAVLNLNGVCERCNVILTKGARAAIGVRETVGPRALLCLACLAKLEPE